MLQCRVCQAALTDGQQFCDQCGHPVVEKVACGSCGYLCSPTAKFCGKCGTTLGLATEPQDSVVDQSSVRIEPQLSALNEELVDSPVANTPFAPSKKQQAVSPLFPGKDAARSGSPLVFGRWSEHDLKRWLRVTGMVAGVGLVGMLAIVQLTGGEDVASAAESAASFDLSKGAGAVVQAGALAPGADQPASNTNRRIIYQLGNIPAATKPETNASEPVVEEATDATGNTAAHTTGATGGDAGQSVVTPESKNTEKPKAAKSATGHDAEVEAARKAMQEFMKQQQSQ